MGFTIREIDTECKFSSTLMVKALHRVIPPAMVAKVLSEERVRHQRERRMTTALIV